MGQFEIMQIMKKFGKGKIVNINDIHKEYIKRYNTDNKNSISICLSKLRKFDMVKFSSENGKYGNEVYSYWL